MVRGPSGESDVVMLSSVHWLGRKGKQNTRKRNRWLLQLLVGSRIQKQARSGKQGVGELFGGLEVGPGTYRERKKWSMSFLAFRLVLPFCGATRAALEIHVIRNTK